MMVGMLVSFVSTWQKLVIWEEEISIKKIPLSDWPVGMPMVHFIDWFPVHCGHCHHWDSNSWMKKALENKPVSITPSSPLRDYIRIIWYFELRISSSGQLWQKKQPWLSEISIFEIRSSASSSGSAHRSYDLESPRLAALIMYDIQSGGSCFEGLKRSWRTSETLYCVRAGVFGQVWRSHQ